MVSTAGGSSRAWAAASSFSRYVGSSTISAAASRAAVVTLLDVPFLRPPVFGEPLGRPTFFTAFFLVAIYFRDAQILGHCPDYEALVAPRLE